MAENLTLIAVGDVCPNRDQPESIFAGTASYLNRGDIVFGQLETNLSERGIPQMAMYPGLIAHPKNVKALTYAGFDVLSFASNHTLDWSDEALFDTLDVLKKNNIKTIGAGKNIEEARRAEVIECKGTKVGFLAYCSVVPKGFEARQDRAGVAPMRATTSYEQIDWQPGTPPRIISVANKEDLSAMVKDITSLRSRVDVLVVSMHWGIHFVPSIIAMYQHEVGHAAIDAGADIIIGHHAHILKGIDVYKGKPIFFSLCNFAFDMSYERWTRNLNVPRGTRVAHWTPDPEYPTYGFSPDSRKTILVKCSISNKKIQEVSFLPVVINKQGQPEIMPHTDARSDEVNQYMQWLCKDQGLETKFSRKGDETIVLT